MIKHISHLVSVVNAAKGLATFIATPLAAFDIGDTVQYTWQKGYLGTVVDNTGTLIEIKDVTGNTIWAPSHDLELFELTTPPQIQYSRTTDEDLFSILDEVTRMYGDSLQCECGKEKHGFARHSDWCAKYES